MGTSNFSFQFNILNELLLQIRCITESVAADIRGLQCVFELHLATLSDWLYSDYLYC